MLKRLMLALFIFLLVIIAGCSGEISRNPIDNQERELSKTPPTPSFQEQLANSKNAINEYVITPEPEYKDDCFLVEEQVSVMLLGYDDAESVSFIVAYIGTDAPPNTLFKDEDRNDGWKYVGQLPGKGGQIALWTEIELADGEKTKSSLILMRVL